MQVQCFLTNNLQSYREAYLEHCPVSKMEDFAEIAKSR